MAKYLKEFKTHAEYEAYKADKSNFIRPNVSFCNNAPNEVHFNPWIDTRVICKFNVTDTSNPTKILNDTSNVSDITVDRHKQDSVTTIEGSYGGGYNFAGCTGITTVAIGSGITYLGAHPFDGCDSIESMTITAIAPPTIGSVSFPGEYPIYVPAESVDAYKAAGGWWDYYKDRIQAISE